MLDTWKTATRQDLASSIEFLDHACTLRKFSNIKKLTSPGHVLTART